VTRVTSFLNARRATVVPPKVGRMQAIREGCVESLGATLRYDRPLTDSAERCGYVCLRESGARSRLLGYRAHGAP
jgi:hypothetical protein